MIADRASGPAPESRHPAVVARDGVLYTLDEPAPTSQELREVYQQDAQRGSSAAHFTTHPRDRFSRFGRLRGAFLLLSISSLFLFPYLFPFFFYYLCPPCALPRQTFFMQARHSRSGAPSPSRVRRLGADARGPSGLPPAIREPRVLATRLILRDGPPDRAPASPPTLAAMNRHDQPDPHAQTDHGRGPDRVPASRPAVVHPPARGRLDTASFQDGLRYVPAPGPGHHPGGGDSQSRDHVTALRRRDTGSV